MSTSIDLVISRLTAEKNRILKLRDDFKQRGDVLDYDTIAALERAAETIELDREDAMESYSARRNSRSGWR